MGNYFDKYDPQPEAPPLPPGANYFDKYDPPVIAETPKKSASASDRVQAAEGGILGGSAYLATAIPDAAANAWNLGKAGLALPWILQDKVPPHALQVSSGPSPLGAALTRQMDKSPITTTQPVNPDDTASRYLAAGGQAIPGALSGGGGVGTMVANAVRGAVPSMVGQAMADHPATDNDTANRGLALTAQLLSGAAMSPGRMLKPENAVKNKIVQDAKEAGAVFPPATTNPSVSNRFVQRIAGKDALPQHAALENQGAVNNSARVDLGLSPGHGALDDSELAQAAAQPSQAYDALRSAGPLKIPPSFASDLQAATANNTAISQAAPALGNKTLATVVKQLSNNKTLDSQTVLVLNRKVRDMETAAWREGDSTSAKEFGKVSDVLENAIEYGLGQKQSVNAGQMLDDYRQARQTFARIDTVKRARTPAGDIDAMKLKAMEVKNPGRMSGQLGVMAKASAIALQAFKVPTSTAGAQHMGMWGSLGGAAMGLFGAHAAGGHVPEGAGAYAALAGAAAIPAARTMARVTALSRFGQRNSNILPTQRAPMSLGQILANYPALAAGVR